MKIPLSVQIRYDEQREEYVLLSKRVVETIRHVKEDGWHFTHRLKQLESYALKLETGRYINGVVDDFFACTLVVENRSSVQVAEQLIRKHFQVHERRPRDPSRTHKQSDAFPFDDLRLYASIPVIEQARPSGLENIRFEVQVKTFLQHAWAIATHDLVYKGDAISWAKERIAFQVKAMLEHAELSIDRSEQLREAGSISLETDETIRLTALISFLSQRWPEDRLPKDKTRLAKIIDSLLFALNLKFGDLERSMVIEEKNGRGAKTLHLSPYGAILNCLLTHHKSSVVAYGKRNNKRYRIFVSPEIDSFSAEYASMRDVFQVLPGTAAE